MAMFEQEYSLLLVVGMLIVGALIGFAVGVCVGSKAQRERDIVTSRPDYARTGKQPFWL